METANQPAPVGAQINTPADAELLLNELEGRQAAVFPIDAAQARTLMDSPDELLPRLMAVADRVREHHHGRKVKLCSIVNAKSGDCPEKCVFCSQSVHYEANKNIERYPMMSADTIVDRAHQAQQAGAREFSIVTASREVKREKEMEILTEAVERINSETELESCASIGLMSGENLVRLRKAGLTNFHHNLETAPSHHKNIVQSHTFEEEVEVVRTAKRLGFNVCCGGIFGMGESPDQRVELLAVMQDIGVDSVPLNFLNPIEGTPIAERDIERLTPEDCLRIIAVARLLMPEQDIFVCGGREVNLGERQSEMFKAGANGTMIGNYLTTAGNSAEADHALIRDAGMTAHPCGAD